MPGEELKADRWKDFKNPYSKQYPEDKPEKKWWVIVEKNEQFCVVHSSWTQIQTMFSN